MNKKISETSWGGVAKWYDEVVEEKGSYQKDVILPNILRLVDVKKGDKILDLACGQGFFASEFEKLGADVVASDISSELINIAKEKNKNIKFVVSPADDISFLGDNTVDKITIILALQNIDNLNGVFKECRRILKTNGKLFVVLNHPAFRIPKVSSWGFDDEMGVQYRRLDSYLSESRIKIDMTPGSKENKKFTISFHRSLQTYFKAFKNNGFCVENFEEWISDRKSEPGKRQKAEDRARKEFPMFAMIEASKM